MNRRRRICRTCTRVAVEGQAFCSRCAHARGDLSSDTTYRRNSLLLMRSVSADTVCGLCGEGWDIKDRWVVDHRVSRRAGGSSEMTNLWVVHASCNRAKSDKSFGRRPRDTGKFGSY